MITALRTLATQQAAPNETTLRNVHQFLYYSASHPDAIITFNVSDMVLVGHSDAYYLSKSKACSRARGNIFLSNNSSNPPNNGAVLTIAQIIKAVMSSVAEAELVALYINFREARPARHALIAMVRPQPPTLMQMDNTTALGVVSNNISPRQTKYMDMRFHWLRCQKAQ